MKVRLSREMKNLVSEMMRASDWIEEGKYDEAFEVFSRGRAMAVRLGLPHARIAWGLCVTADARGDVETAMKMAIEAVDQDPLGAEYRHSLAIVAARIRAILEDPSREAGDPSTPRLYHLLVDTDQAEDGSHLAMARYLLHQGEREEALRLLRALTTLSSMATEAWELRAEIGEELGDEKEKVWCGGIAALCERYITSPYRGRGLKRPQHDPP